MTGPGLPSHAPSSLGLANRHSFGDQPAPTVVDPS